MKIPWVAAATLPPAKTFNWAPSTNTPWRCSRSTRTRRRPTTRSSSGITGRRCRCEEQSGNEAGRAVCERNWCADDRSGSVNVQAVSILNVVAGDLITFAEGHHMLGGQIDTALAAAAPAVATMPATYGPVGAVLISAIDEFQATLTATGTALVGQYQQMSEALHNAAGMYVSVDEASGAAIALSGGHDRADGLNDTA